MFALQNPPADIAVAGLKLSSLKLDLNKSKFDLTLEVEEQASGLRAAFEYNTDLFAPATMQRMLEHFQNLLTAIVRNPDQNLVDLSLLSESETHKLLVE